MLQLSCTSPLFNRQEDMEQKLDKWQEPPQAKQRLQNPSGPKHLDDAFSMLQLSCTSPFFNWQEDMEQKLDKWQEPPQAKQSKVLPQPDMEPKKRRGGRRYRKMKERYGLTGVGSGACQQGISTIEEGGGFCLL